VRTTKTSRMWDNCVMVWPSRVRLMTGLVLALAAAGSRAVLAQGAVTAAMQVGAAVHPQCRITVDEATTVDPQSPAVHVTCGRSALQALRVTSRLGATMLPVTASENGNLRAGGEVVFVVPNALTIVASRVPFVASAPAPHDPVVVTLDF
jgi:hypothetical protein